MFRRRRRQDDFAAEVESHLQIESERLQAEGLSEGDARAAALRAFGNVASARERFYDSRRWLWWDHVCRDFQYGARMLRKSPGFTAVAVLTMALGVGATTAIFSVVDATLLHPLPYPHPEQLVWIEDDLPGVPAHDVGMSQPEMLDLARAGIFEYVSPAWFDENNLTGSPQPARVNLDSVAPSYFALLGVMPRMGRAFDPNDHSAGYLGEVVISDGLWKRLFGSDPSVLNKNIRLDTDLYRIVGVMPGGFRAPGRTPQERNVEVWAATNFYGPPLPDHPPRSGRNIPGAIGRLQPGLTIDAAQAKVDSLVGALQREYPDDYPPQSAWAVRLRPLNERVVGDLRRTLVLLLGAVGLVLLIGCVNIANLLLARASARGRELAIRQALGAAKRRLVQQLLTESLLLSFVGGTAGVVFLLAAKQLLLSLVPESLPRLNDISISWSVLRFALGASLASGVILGLVPALHINRLGPAERLKQEGRTSTTSSSQARTRRILAVTQFALSLVLLVAAGLLLRSFQDLMNVPLGFNPERVMAIRTRLPYPNDTSIDKYRTVSQLAPFIREILRRVRTLPGVDEAAVGDNPSIPLVRESTDLYLKRRIVTFERSTHSDQPSLIDGSLVTPEYFHVLGLTLERGRLFSDLDSERTEPVAVINQAMARTYWPDEDPLGKRVKLSRTATTWTTVVGIVADARTETLADAGVPHIYASLYQYERGAKHLAIFLRGTPDEATIQEKVRTHVQAEDPTLPVYGAQMLTAAVADSLSGRRFSMEVVGLFALTALVLAGLGVYGVISYIVSERTHEISIRLALGARRTTIVRMILYEALGLVAAGGGVGLVGAVIVSRVINGMLFGIRPTDPVTFAGVTIVLSAVAAIACYIPARRAVHVDPIVALRCE